MATESVSFEMDASPENVWQVTGEQWDGVSRIIPSISESELIDGTTVEEGVARRCTLAEPTFGMEFVEERLVELEPPRTFTYEMLEPPFPMRRLGNRWSVEASGTGTRLTLQPFAELRGRPLTKWLEGFVLKRLINSLESDQQEMRVAIERAANDLEAEE